MERPRLYTTEERKAWLIQWASQNPSASTHTARNALRAQFEMTLGTKTIVEVLHDARERAGLKQPVRRRTTEDWNSKTLAAIVDRLRAMGVKKLVITEDDFECEVNLRGSR